MSDRNSLTPMSGNSGSPFDHIRHTDAFGREYWLGREMQPLMGYEGWRRFEDAIERAIRAAKNSGTYSEAAFLQVTQLVEAGNLGPQERREYHLSRYAAYLVALNGDPIKPEVAAAQAYFAIRTREAELGALTIEEKRQTALARAREMIDYQVFRDMMAENATDYEPSSDASRRFFATMQNRLYVHLTGMTAKQIKQAREICHWKGRETGKLNPTKADRKIAKNYLFMGELNKLDRIVSRLGLRAEDIAEDGLSLSLAAWEDLVDTELAVLSRRPLVA